MPAAYTIELRRRIVRAYAQGQGSVRELAKLFAVAPNTVQSYRNLLRDTGSLAPRPHGGGVKPRLDRQGLEEVRRLTQEMPDATLAELAKELAQRCNVGVSIATMSRTLQRARRGAKKSASRDRA
jgi:transposase